MAISSYKDLVVWQKSFKLVKEVYKFTSNLPRNETFGLSSQMQRSAVSIPSNISEGQQRNNVKEYKQFLGVARGSAAELNTQVLLARDVYKIGAIKLLEDIEEIQKMLYVLIKKL